MLYCNKDHELLIDPYKMNESKLKDIASLLSASIEIRADLYALQRYVRTGYKAKDEIPTRASLPVIIT